MKREEWLTNKQIYILVSELLLPDMELRLPQRLHNIYNQYVEANGMQLFDLIVSTLASFQKRIDILLDSNARLAISGLDFDDGMGTPLPPLPKDKSCNSADMLGMKYEDCINMLRETCGYPRYVLYGPHTTDIQGIRGKITWNEVERVRQLVVEFKREKVSHKILNAAQTNGDYIQRLDSNTENDPKLKSVEKALNRLKIFDGKNEKGQVIMNKVDYDRMVTYVQRMILDENLPDSIESVSQIGLKNQFISYTFYLIHAELYTTKSIRTYFIDFLRSFFDQLKGASWEVTKNKFSTHPPSYEADIAKMASM